MYYILFNPLSKSGKNKKTIAKLELLLTKKNETFQSYNLIEIQDIPAFIKQLNPQDKVVFVGGDGTIHYVANFLRHREFEQKIYAYGAGTGNDFFRNIESQEDGLPQINQHIQNLPVVTHHGGEEVFVNGCGLGVDAEVCRRVNKSRSDSALAYGLNAIRSFLTYRPFDCTLEVDGIQHSFKKVWIVSIMHGKYQGGGMLFAPDAVRDDEWLEVMVAYKMSRLSLIFLFPSIYKGQHLRYQSKGLAFFKVKKVSIQTVQTISLQMDGEVREKINAITITR